MEPRGCRKSKKFTQVTPSWPMLEKERAIDDCSTQKKVSVVSSSLWSIYEAWLTAFLKGTCLPGCAYVMHTPIEGALCIARVPLFIQAAICSDFRHVDQISRAVPVRSSSYTPGGIQVGYECLEIMNNIFLSAGY